MDGDYTPSNPLPLNIEIGPNGHSSRIVDDDNLNDVQINDKIDMGIPKMQGATTGSNSSFTGKPQI